MSYNLIFLCQRAWERAGVCLWQCYLTIFKMSIWLLNLKSTEEPVSHHKHKQTLFISVAILTVFSIFAVRIVFVRLSEFCWALFCHSQCAKCVRKHRKLIISLTWSRQNLTILQVGDFLMNSYDLYKNTILRKKKWAWRSTPNLTMKVCYLSPFINNCFVK